MGCHRKRGCQPKRGGRFWLCLLIAGLAAMWLLHGHKRRTRVANNPVAGLQERQKEPWDYMDLQGKKHRVLRFKRDAMRYSRDVSKRLGSLQPGVGTATVEVRFLGKAVDAQGLDAADLAVAVKKLITVMKIPAEDQPNGTVPIVRLANTIVRDDAVGQVRLGDIARLSRRRAAGRNAWQDTEVMVGFSGTRPAEFSLKDLRVALRPSASPASEGSDAWKSDAWKTDGKVLVYRFPLDRPLGDHLIPSEALATATKHHAAAEKSTESKTSQADSTRIEPPSPKPQHLKEPAAGKSVEIAEAGGEPKAEPSGPKEIVSAAKLKPPAEDVASEEATKSTHPEIASNDRPEPPTTTTEKKSSPSVAPADTAARPTAGEDEPPAWIGKTSYFADGVQHVFVSEGPFIDKQQCQEALPHLLTDSTQKYLREYLGWGSAVKPLRFPLAYVQAEVLKNVWIGPWQDRTDGILPSREPFDRYGLYVALEFDQHDYAYFQHLWHAQQMSNRLYATGVVSGLLLSLLGIVFGYLRSIPPPADTTAVG